jgi:periplasmic protein CpxP/Spy
MPRWFLKNKITTCFINLKKEKMRQKILAVIVFSILLTGFAYSQDGPPSGGPPSGGPPSGKDMKKMTPEEMAKMELKMFKSELDLTDSQIPFVQKILEESAKKMQSLMDKKTSKDSDEMKALTEEKESNLKSVLTDDQWTKYIAVKSKMKDKQKDNSSDKK